MTLNPPPLKLYNCANFALNNINEFAKGQGYAVSKNGGGSQDAFADGLPSVSGNISQAYSVVGPCPFSTTLLRSPLVHSSFDLNSTSCTIVDIKT